MGALSFGSRHADGKYHDHMGTKQVHDTLSEVTIHHETETIVGTGQSAGDNLNKLTSQLGQDSIIYKMTDAGVPVSVYAMDTMPADGNPTATAPTAIGAAGATLPASTTSTWRVRPTRLPPSV